jgi:D-3-phosphoglycerate dehydrogenase
LSPAGFAPDNPARDKTCGADHRFVVCQARSWQTTKPIVRPTRPLPERPTALLINTARGAIFAETALIDALTAGRIAGAGLDVFSTEPQPPGHPPGHPLAQLPNVVITPHCAGITPEALEAGLRMAVENIWEFLDGRPAHVVIA